MPVMTGTALNNLSYEDLVRWVNLSSGNPDYLDKYIAEAAKYGVDEMSAVEDMAATYMNFYKDGNGAYTITSFNSDAQISAINAVDSNISTISRGNVQTPLNRGIDAITGKLNITRFPASGSFAQRAGYVLGSVGSAAAAVSTGITLGKIISPMLYDANPDFWDSIGISEGSFDPQTWNSITNGDNSWQAGLFNFILGLDPDTGNSQLYMNQDAFAYMAYALAQNGIFDSGSYQQQTQDVTIGDKTYSGIKKIATTDSGLTYKSDSRTYHISNILASLINWSNYVGLSEATNDTFRSHNFCTVQNNASSSLKPSILFTSSVQPNQYDRTYYWFADGSGTGSGSSQFSSYTYDGKTVYYRYLPFYNTNTIVSTAADNTNIVLLNSDEAKNFAWVMEYGEFENAGGGIDGITNQDGATLPNISDWNDIPSTLSSLQNQYPDLWDNPLVWDNYQPDGTNPQQVYIPVATPNSTTGTNTQPTSANSTQTNPQVNPDTSTQTLIDFLTNVMTQPNPQTNPQTQEETDTQPKIPPQNPVDTGTGETPTPLPPVGSASALWSVYHPTQAQVNSFGAWLWGSPFLTNIGKLFQNPIEGVISLHKVFVTPVDSGSGTIVVGTLDSGVSSATVNQQYIEIDCGSIDCYEEFGNVFDYDPYTKIALYLPFVGIVPLNVCDIMRSTISVKYGVDIFTGACIAMVEVSRDGNNATLYQYSGNCAVHYPLSNVQQSQLLSGLITVAAGVGAIVATGGAAAPAAATGIASGAMSALHTNIGRSGGFSANAGAMGIKTPYLIIERPQTKLAETFPELAGYPTNYSCKLNECSGHVVVKHVHIEGINATDSELDKINNLLMSGIIV